MRHNQIVFSFLLIHFEHERLWHYPVPELDFKNRYLNIWGIKVLNLILGHSIESYTRGKISDHYLSLLITYLAVPKPTFSHRTNRESQPCLLDGNHCALSVWSKGASY